MSDKKHMNVALLIGLLITVVLIVSITIMSAKKDAEEVQKLKEAEVIVNQETEDLGNAMQGVKEDIEAGYEDLDSAIGE